MKILVFAEQRDGKLKSSAKEALTAAAKLSSGNAGDVAALIIGSSVESLASELSGYGADTVYIADKPELEKYNCLNYTAALADAVKSFSADVLIGGASPMGKDLFPRLAARLDAGIVTDVTELTADGNNLSAQKPMYAGKVISKVLVQGDGLKIASIRPNVFAAEQTGQGSATVSKLDVTLPESRLKTKEVRKGVSEKADLTEAAVIISGGRSLGSAEKFSILEECADVIGATVGASRAAVDAGYAPHHMQVGQTGKTVNPNLYIACGISGAIQHMAGMRTSKIIVAINTDPEAPIFNIADYGIVADLFEAVPIMTQKFKEIL